MFGQKFYNGVIRKYVIYFGTLFNDIEIDRVDSTGAVVQQIKVPIAYGPKEKYLARIEAVGENLDRKVAVRVPTMSFEMTGFQYAPERRLNPNKSILRVNSSEANALNSVSTPTPFDITFQLAIFIRNAEDGVRILEQILPYFTPEFTASLKILDDLDYSVDVPVVFNGLSTEDIYEGGFDTRRVLIHTLDFTMKAYVFGPISNKKGIIKTANSQFYIDTSATGSFDLSNDVFASEIVVEPGLDANGNPTTNSSITIDKSIIAANDNYDFIVTKNINDE